jgi:hypothetical protein
MTQKNAEDLPRIKTPLDFDRKYIPFIFLSMRIPEKEIFLRFFFFFSSKMEGQLRFLFPSKQP